MDGYQRSVKYSKMYFNVMKEDWVDSVKEGKHETLRSLSLDIQSATNSVASPTYNPGRSHWTKLRSAIFMKSVMSDTKKKK